jgi:selenide,water dikinase
VLDAVLRRLPRQTDSNVLVGFDTNDDAGVYLVAPDLALVQTVDFFTPIVDDPNLFGQIAAANSLSDVYAMGGRPISALSIVGFPEKGDPAVLEAIIRGGLTKMLEAGCSVIGGHSIRDDELKFGYAVTGVIDPRRVWRNVGAQPGDALLLTKPLGTGVIATALKKNRATPESIAAAVASMARLNRAAAEALREIESTFARHSESAPGGRRISRRDASLRSPKAHSAQDDNSVAAGPIHAVTDITGFGLLGHAHEMAAGSKVSLEIDHAKIGYLSGAIEAAREGHLAGGLKNNRDFVGACVGFAENVPEEFRALLFDPQTSGGLLVAIAAESSDAALKALARRGVDARRIGRVTVKQSPLLAVR